MARGTMRRRIPEHHAFICRMHLERIDSISGWVEQLTARIEEAMAPFQAARDFLTTIPGVNTIVADVLVAETGADMSRF